MFLQPRVPQLSKLILHSLGHGQKPGDTEERDAGLTGREGLYILELSICQLLKCVGRLHPETSADGPGWFPRSLWP